MKIGLMGGTFDPVHYAHLALAEAAISEAGLSKVIMIPAYIQPFKRNKYVTSDEHRLAMLEIALRTSSDDLSNIEISDWEIERGGISYTYDTLIHFKEVYPDDELYFILGTDTYMKLESWHKGQDLLRSCNFIVGIRPEDVSKDDSPSDNDSPILSESDNKNIDNKKNDSKIKSLGEYYLREYGTKTIIMNSPMLPINSTMIRDLIEEEKPVSGLVPPEVENYIYDNRLYI